MESTPALTRSRVPGVLDRAAAPVAPPEPRVAPNTGPRRGRRAVGTSIGDRRARVVVLEPRHAYTPPDRIDEECEVVLRLAVPTDGQQLVALLDRLRPRLLLVKDSLDSVDEHVLTTCLGRGIDVMMLARPAYGLLRPPTMRRFGGLPWIRLGRGTTRPEAGLKRCFDIVVASAAITLLLPVLLLIAVAASVGGPPLYFQERVGAGGRLFRMVKFRTMRVGAERETGPVLFRPGDERVTRVGHLLRRSRLDELPQLWNVLRGQMSLVGPRPERPEFIAEFQRLPYYDLRHLIRPGLTGIAQLTGGYAATVEEKLRCDLVYLNCRSIRVDLTLLLLTAADLLRGFPRG